jgi:hypothetical protein
MGLDDETTISRVILTLLGYCLEDSRWFFPRKMEPRPLLIEVRPFALHPQGCPWKHFDYVRNLFLYLKAVFPLL